MDGAGNVYTTGWFGGTADFDPGAGTSNLTSVGSKDIFVSKLDSAGNFVYARQLGGTQPGDFRNIPIAVDGSGNVYTTGPFTGTVDFDPGAGTSNLTSARQPMTSSSPSWTVPATSSMPASSAGRERRPGHRGGWLGQRVHDGVVQRHGRISTPARGPVT